MCKHACRKDWSWLFNVAVGSIEHSLTSSAPSVRRPSRPPLRPYPYATGVGPQSGAGISEMTLTTISASYAARIFYIMHMMPPQSCLALCMYVVCEIFGPRCFTRTS